MVTPIAIRKLKRLELHLPPPHLFEALLGCRNNNRFFALHWLRKARLPILNDGVLETVGAVEPYRVWRYHPRVLAVLAGYNIGDAADIARHWLFVDRQTRSLYVGEIPDVQRVLEYQHRGVIDPLPEAGGAGRGPDLQPVRPCDMIISAKSFRMQMPVSIKHIHELETWLAGNL